MSKYEELDAMIMDELDYVEPMTFMAIHFSGGIHSGIHAECESWQQNHMRDFESLIADFRRCARKVLSYRMVQAKDG